MSYENLNSTKMLATRCAVCSRPLRDAVSAEIGIGPDCREKHGYSEAVNDSNRAAANRLIYEIADAQTGINAVEAARQLRNLGFGKLATIIATKLMSVRLEWAEGEEGKVLLVRGPYTESAVEAFRSIPGRRWNKELHANVVPYVQKNTLWAAIKKAYPGHDMLTQDGEIVSIPRAA